MNRILTRRTVRLLSLVLLFITAAQLVQLLKIAVFVLQGRMDFYFNGTYNRVNPALGGASIGLIGMPHVTGKGEAASAAAKLGISIGGLMWLLPLMAGGVLLGLVYLRLYRGRLLEGKSCRLLFSAGLICLLFAILIPLINGYAIPALVKASSGDILGLPLTLSTLSDMLKRGLGCILCASLLNVYRQGQRI